jgi:hypothetical protein
MADKKIRWVEERRYVNTQPENGVRFTDVEVDGVQVTGVARHGKYIVLRMRRGATNVYVFYELLDSIDRDALTDAEFLKRLVALNYENEVIKKRIEELREFADKLETHLRDLPVVISAMSINEKSHGHVEVKLAQRVDNNTFQRYTSTCKALGMRFDSVSRVWVYVPEWSQYITVRYCGTRGC